MAADFSDVFATLKAILAKHAKRLTVKVDTPIEYTVLTKSPRRFLSIRASLCISDPCA